MLPRPRPKKSNWRIQMAEKKKTLRATTPKAKTPAWTLVQGKGCWIVEGKNRHHFDTEEAAKKFLAALDS